MKMKFWGRAIFKGQTGLNFIFWNTEMFLFFVNIRLLLIGQCRSYQKLTVQHFTFQINDSVSVLGVIDWLKQKSYEISVAIFTTKST